MYFDFFLIAGLLCLICVLPIFPSIHMKHLPLDVTQPTINHPDIHIYDGKSDLLPSFLYLQFAKYFFLLLKANGASYQKQYTRKLL